MLADGPQAGWSAYPRHIDFAAFRYHGRRDLARSLWVQVHGAFRAVWWLLACTDRRVRYADDVVSTTDAYRRWCGARFGFDPGQAAIRRRPSTRRCSPRTQGGPDDAGDRRKGGHRSKIAGDAGVRRTPAPHDFPVPASSPTGCWAPTSNERASASSPAAPTSTLCSSTFAIRHWTARPPRICCTTSASRSTATPCRTIRDRPWSRRACGSTRPRWPPAASATPSSPRSPTSSPLRWLQLGRPADAQLARVRRLARQVSVVRRPGGLGTARSLRHAAHPISKNM